MKTKTKVKRMITRRKIKTEPDWTLTKDKTIHDWANKEEIDQMNKDELNRIIARLQKEGLSESEIKMCQDLHYKRSKFTVDEYVKLGDVRKIVQDALFTLIPRMNKAEEIALNNRYSVETFDKQLSETKR